MILLNLNLSSSGLNNMRGYEGIDILDFLKATGRKTPVIVFTSEGISTSNIYHQYPNVIEFFFKGTKKGFAKNLSDIICKSLN